MENESTEIWRNRTEVAETIQELRGLLRQMSAGHLGWRGYLLAEKESRSFRNAQVAARAGVTRQAFEKWLNKGVLPDSRDAFLRLGMAFGMGLNEINRMLQRYGAYPQLYPKNAHDAVCIYVISRYAGGHSDSESYRDYPFGRVEALEALLRDLRPADFPKGQKDEQPTQMVKDGLLSVNGDAGFLGYMASRRDVFLSPTYQRLRHYIDDFVRIQETDAVEGGNPPTIHQLVLNGILNPAFEKLLSQLLQKDEVPRRSRLIAMGIQFNMTVEMLDQMLALAHMEPLCARLPVEMALIYAIRSAHLYDPTLEYEIASRLSRFARESENIALSRDIVALHERIYSAPVPEAPDFGTLSRYVAHVLRSVDLTNEAQEVLTTLESGRQP